MNTAVTGLQIAPTARTPMKNVNSVTATAGSGIAGDRYEGSKHRQVSVQSLEEIALAEAEIGRSLDAVQTRRNITLAEGRFDRTPGALLTIGDVELEVVRDAAPCKLLEDEFGKGAKLALHKRAGVICRVLTSGTITVGDSAIVQSETATSPKMQQTT